MLLIVNLASIKLLFKYWLVLFVFEGRDVCALRGHQGAHYSRVPSQSARELLFA